MKKQAKITEVHEWSSVRDAPPVVAWLHAGVWYSTADVRAAWTEAGNSVLDRALPYTEAALTRRAAYGLSVPTWEAA